MSNKKTPLLVLAFGALGVVYGDIGTSPLYAINEIFFGRGGKYSPSNVVGLISVVLWALILIVAIKYVIFVLRADNDGEGGVFALVALLRRHKVKTAAVLALVLTFGAGLLFGDGIITPAISVLSAVEGLKIATPALASFVIPITIAILTGLFLVQRKGTAVIGKVFGPIILLWFITIAALGIRQLIIEPSILRSFNPLEAIQFIIRTKPYELLIILGSVMLVVTGGEALYADMGHFGRSPIRLSWFTVVMPCLMLSYLGQGAYLLSHKPVADSNIFFSMVPHTLLYPMVILAAFATVIASQALISGAFSLASQGIALGLLPRLKIHHTHQEHEGQIYLPFINWSLYIGCVALVVSFKTSSNLAAAYGLAVSAVMLITAVSVLQVARLEWGWKKFPAFLLFGSFALIDLCFLAANSLKVFVGGYVPLTIGLLLFIVMGTWQWGKGHVRRTFLGHSSMTMRSLLKIKEAQPAGVSSNLLVLTVHNPVDLDSPVPPLVELFFKKFKHMPQHLIILTVVQTKRPYERGPKRLEITSFENNHQKETSLLSIKARFGFLEEPNVERVIAQIATRHDLTPDDTMDDWIVYVGRERIIIPKTHGIHVFRRIRARLYAFMMRNSSPSYEYYGLGKDGRVSVELVPVRID